MKKSAINIFAALTLFFVGDVFSQAVTLDGVSGGVSNDTIFVNQQVQFNIRLNTNGTTFAGITNGFKISSPDGAEWGNTVADTFSHGWNDIFDLIYTFDHFSITGSFADTVGFGGAALFGTGILGSFDDVAYSITIGPIDPLSHKKQICLDSAFYLPSGVWKWAGPDLIPSWDGPHCYTVIDPSAPADPSNIVLSPDFLNFTSIEGGSPPPGQSFDVLTDQDLFSFTLNESATWIFISPTQGNSGQSIITTINTTGLVAGTYVDSIEVIAPAADNSPQWIVVTLEVDPPPPTIAVTPNSVLFNAVAGEANPADKIISISNSATGSIDLEWSVSNSESWLSLSPTSGTNSGDVTISIDITGLGFNDYADTIFITDPQATNNPVKVPVNLSVGSDLPLIAVDSVFNYIIVPSGVSTIPNRDIVVFNGGAGGMTYSLSESSTRIFTLTPSSGTAPDTVSVNFKILGHNPGDEFTDTLWVTSPEAINSPFPVIFQFHYVDVPAEILMVDTVVVDVFECDQGAFALNPQGFFTVSNVVGGESFYPTFEFESDLFTLEFDNNIIPEFVSVVANDLQLPLGTYIDTIVVSALNAINSPQSIIVKYNVIPGITTPKIVIPTTNFVIPTRENEGPQISAVLGVLNLFGGCMEWDLTEDISWLFPEDTTGNVPGNLELTVLADGLTLGTYYDTLSINALSASNSPQLVTFELKVWKLAGDFNWDGFIDIADLVLMVSYFFGGGTIGPQPEIRVADIDCDLLLTITDIVLLVDYMFKAGPIPCDNPY